MLKLASSIFTHTKKSTHCSALLLILYRAERISSHFFSKIPLSYSFSIWCLQTKKNLLSFTLKLFYGRKTDWLPRINIEERKNPYLFHSELSNAFRIHFFSLLSSLTDRRNDLFPLNRHIFNGDKQIKICVCQALSFTHKVCIYFTYSIRWMLSSTWNVNVFNEFMRHINIYLKRGKAKKK